uniref:Uncharacterized protein n=1 Tax=Fervidobacterium pennivorans TaxID=93466 RepID=A0A7V4CMP5_FERPE
MKKLYEYNFKSQLVIFSDIKNTVAKNLGIKDLYYSRKGERPSRPGLIQKKGFHYLVSFLSTKKYSDAVFKVFECCPFASERIFMNESRIMNIGGRYVFILPAPVIENYKRQKKIQFLSGCALDLENWSDECVERV